MTVEEFDSGAIRDSQEGKIKFELITPTFKQDLAAMLTDKAKHYGDRNWEKGIPTARTFSSLLRHVEALGRGEWLDEESGHPHTVLAAANLMFVHEFHGTEFDTLHELVGPSLRSTRHSSDSAYAEAFPSGSLHDDVINQGDPEPPRSTEWQDTVGALWSYRVVAVSAYEPDIAGWGYVNPHENIFHYVGNWDPDDPADFPWVRVK